MDIFSDNHGFFEKKEIYHITDDYWALKKLEVHTELNDVNLVVLLLEKCHYHPFEIYQHNKDELEKDQHQNVPPLILIPIGETEEVYFVESDDDYPEVNDKQFFGVDP